MSEQSGTYQSTNIGTFLFYQLGLIYFYIKGCSILYLSTVTFFNTKFYKGSIEPSYLGNP